MPTVRLTLPTRAYDIVIEPGALGRLGDLVRAVAPHDRATAVCDETIDATHAATARQSLIDAGYDLAHTTMHASEKKKTLDTVAGLLDAMLEHRMERRSPVIAIGGGITGDCAGYAAASLLRGVPFVQCPTTLLAMVDASVGGKTGVNARQGKNLIGAFHQPAIVVIDTDTLKTLSQADFICGLAECVKHGVIRDADLFDWIDANADAILALDSDTLIELVQRNVKIKAAVVEADEKESGVRAHLNFGHTFGHAIEGTQYAGDDSENPSGYKHGQAVALGMVAATRLAVDTRRCEAKVLDRLVTLLNRLGLPTSSDRLADTADLMCVMGSDKKVKDGRVRLVLPEAMGRVAIVDDASKAEVETAWAALRG